MPQSPSRRYSKYVPLLFFSFDLLGLNLSILGSSYFKFGYLFEDSFHPIQLVINLSWILAFFSARLHETERELGIIDQLNRLLTALVVCLSILFGLYFLTRPFYLSREHLFIAFALFSSVAFSWRIIWAISVRYYRAKGYNFRNVVVLGKSTVSERLARYFEANPGFGYRFLGYFDDRQKGDGVLGNFQDLKEFTNHEKIDFIYTYLPKLNDKQINELMDFAENNLIKVKIISQFSKLGNRSFSIQKYGAIPVVNLSEIPLDNQLNRTIKRTFDIIFSGIVMLFILSWLIPLVGFLIKVESRGPVFFKQYRNGLNDKKFLIFKFRTMIVNQEAHIKQATKGDARITRLGSILRKTSIDELPQFINVFLGDMSVVGPRPHAVTHNEEFKKKIDRFIQRHAVKPGITGLAQAKGYRGETPNFSDISGRVKLDRFYVKNWSMVLDFKIILLTIISIFKGSEKAF